MLVVKGLVQGVMSSDDDDDDDDDDVDDGNNNKKDSVGLRYTSVVGSRE
jgi:hypothetical protein